MSVFAPEFSEVEDKDIIAAVMNRILYTINSVFDQAGASLPDRQFITVGAEAHDCQQLTVSFRQLYTGSPGAQAELPQKCNSPRSVVLTIQLVREVPHATSRQNTAPSPEWYNAKTAQQATDAWLLLDGAMTAVDDYIGVIADVAVTDPQGGFQAVVLNMTVGVP